MTKFRDKTMVKLLLTTLDYILEVGLEQALRNLTYVTKEDLLYYPNVKKALEERDICL